MADIVKGIKETCTILGYADDWVVVTSSKAPIRAETRLKEAANSSTRWSSDNGFKISSGKTKIHRRRPRTEGNRFKLIGTEKIEMVNKHRIMGLTFDERLNWKIHIKDVKPKVTIKLNLLKACSTHRGARTKKHSCGSTK
jgi:hypothetical protein